MTRPFALLPPTAAPWSWRAWWASWRASAEAVPAWEGALATRLGATAVRTAASGRAALYLLLRQLAAERPSRREVLLPTYTCPALFRVVEDAGLVARRVDVDPTTLSCVPASVTAALGPATLAVVVVHTLGLPHSLKPVLAAARAAGALVIEDAAQALGATVDGRPAGGGGDFGLVSFGPGKPLSTGGGGAVSARDAAGAALLIRAWAGLAPQRSAAAIIAAARLAALAALFTPHGWWVADRLGAARIGASEAAQAYAVRGLTPFQAAFGLALLPRLDVWNARRRAGAARWRADYSRRPGVLLPDAAPGAAPIYLRFPVLLPDRATRERHVAVWRAAGIGAGRLWMGVGGGIDERLLTLPTWHEPHQARRAARLQARGGPVM